MIKVGFNPAVNFKAGNDTKAKGSVDLSSYKDVIEQVSDEYKDSKENTAKNEPPAQSGKKFNESVAGFWKFFSVANQMANAALKGIFYGALTGLAFLTGSWTFKSLPKAFSKEGPTIWQTLRHPINNISKSGKVIAGVASGAVLAYHLVKGRLESNQKTAVIDHKMKVGHRNV